MIEENNKSAFVFKLSAEAAERIRNRIESRQLSIFQNRAIESDIDYREDIKDKAKAILKAKKLPTRGCGSDRSIDNWLYRKTGKELSVFKALCEAVDECWFDVFDRSPLAEILIKERAKTGMSFINNFRNYSG